MIIVSGIVLLLVLLLGRKCSAWLNHALIAEQALKAVPELDREVSAEPLADFVVEEKFKIAALLADEDKYCRANFPDYRPASALVRLNPEKVDCNNARKSFATAIRINPFMPLNNFVQTFPGDSYCGRTWMDFERVGFVMYNDNGLLPFVELAPGEAVAARRVVSSACDEPDYGLDILLWEDSGTQFGRKYGFGNQPYGPKFLVATQVPIHTDFANETLLCSLSKAWRRSLLHYRIRLYSQLSQLAFATGHEYWGLRLFGWAAHYICDACQPYHVKPMPGFSLPLMVGKFVLAQIGISGWYEQALQDIGNYHLLQEKLLTSYLLQEYSKQADFGFLAALAGRTGEQVIDYRGDFVYRQAAEYAFSHAEGIAAAMRRMITDRAVFDNIYNLDATGEYDVFDCVRNANRVDIDEFQLRMKDCLAHTAVNVRAFCRSRLDFNKISDRRNDGNITRNS
ncbi:MAG: hypothetical protein WCV63_09715 [Negativicutes bacterium]